MNTYVQRFNEEWEKQYPYVDDYGIFVPIEEYKRHDDAGIFKCIITKELFVEAYNKWIKEKEIPLYKECVSSGYACRCMTKDELIPNLTAHATWYEGHGYIDCVDGDPDESYAVPTWICSNCKCEEEHMTDYCPNCGAKMDGDQL